MVARGLEVVRFRKRYYIRHHPTNGHFRGLGESIVARIPTDPDEYHEWLEVMRVEYTAKENAIESYVYNIRKDCKLRDLLLFSEFTSLPSELPRLGNMAEYIYIIDLDREIFIVNHNIDCKLGNIPRQDELRAIADNIRPYKQLTYLDLSLAERMISPALELAEPSWKIDYDFRLVAPRTNIAEARKAFLTSALANMLVQYREELLTFGPEWTPDSFPFRELSFALVSIASGQVKFHSFPTQLCKPRTCLAWDCDSRHCFKLPGRLDEEWVGDSAPLLEFGSMCHRPGERPGVSPGETTYWLEGVFVCLTQVVDCRAIMRAVDAGISQGNKHFQIVLLSLYEVAFAEVSFDDEVKPFVKFSRAVNLSPLRASHSTITHPRIIDCNFMGSTKSLRSHFPGLAALINFFDVSVNRRLASRTREPKLPLELWDMILQFADYDTWKACLQVSTELRACCLRKYRLDDQMSISAGPFKRAGMMSFNFENLETGESLAMTQAHN